MFSRASKVRSKALVVASTVLLLASMYVLDYSRRKLTCSDRYLTVRGEALSKLKILVAEKKNMEEVIKKFGIISFPPPEKRFRALLALMDDIKDIDPSAKVTISPVPDYKTPLDRYTITVRTEAYSWDRLMPFVKVLYQSRYPLVEFNSLEISREGAAIKVTLTANVIMKFGSNHNQQQDEEENQS